MNLKYIASWILGKNPFEAQTLTPDQGIYVKRSLIRSGRRRYQTLTQFYQDHLNVNHPSHIKVRARELEFMPELKIVECGGVWAHVTEVTRRSLQDTLTYLVRAEDLEGCDLSTVKGYYTSGGDACGNNPVYQSKNQTKSNNIIFYGMRLRYITIVDRNGVTRKVYVEKSLGKYHN